MVLAVDLDPQCNLSLASGADILNMDQTLYDVFKGSAELPDLIQKTELGYDLITGGLTLAGADMDFTQTGREFMLREALDSVKADYDFCITDTPPTLGILTVNALTASDSVIIPLTADLYSIQGLSQLNLLIQRVRKYSNKDLEIAGLLITRHDERTNVSKALMDQILLTAEKLGTKVFSKPIRNSVAIRESQVMRADIFTEAPKANATKDYTAFIDELLEKGESKDE
jgi:chromosome partitioning protein